MEYERRFLVDVNADWRRCVRPCSKLLCDRYLECGRLRLRRIEDSDTGRIALKLTKKYDSGSASAQPIVSIWLSAAEHDALRALPGFELRKRRYYDEGAGAVFGIDVFEGELEGLILCEAEVDSAAARGQLAIPGYALHEVTEDPFFTGGSLCRTRRHELAEMLDWLHS